MSITTYRHNLDEKVYLIRTDLPVTRKMLGVQFVNGRAKTKFRERARIFDEEFGYEVTLPAGVKSWPHVTPHAMYRGELEEEESDLDFEEDEDPTLEETD